MWVAGTMFKLDGSPERGEPGERNIGEKINNLLDTFIVD